MLNFSSLMAKKKPMKVPNPAEQGSLPQGTLDQQQLTSSPDPNASFKKRLKQNAPMSFGWLGVMRTGSQAKSY